MNNLLKTAVKGLSFLVILRLFSKVIDFILNILVIREIDPNVYGNFFVLEQMTLNFFRINHSFWASFEPFSFLRQNLSQKLLPKKVNKPEFDRRPQNDKLCYSTIFEKFSNLTKKKKIIIKKIMTKRCLLECYAPAFSQSLLGLCGAIYILIYTQILMLQL